MLDGIALLDKRNQALVEAGERLFRGNFKEGNVLGSGSFAKVRKVTSLSTGRHYAMKILSLKQIRQLKLTDQLRNELNILATCQHENIITLYAGFAEEEQVFLLMELAESSLFDRMVRDFPLSEERVAGYMGDIVRAVVYLHALSPPILHRDLKPENVLIINGKCKIADFGWSNTDNAYRNTYCGTFDYLAPEMILGTGHNEKLDVWTLGVLMFELLEGKPPFGPKEKVADKRLASKITEKNILRGLLEFGRKLSPEAMVAIRHIVNVDESKRPAARDILELEFFKKHLAVVPGRSKSLNISSLGSSKLLLPAASQYPTGGAAHVSPGKQAANGYALSQSKLPKAEKGADARLSQRIGEARAKLDAVESKNRDLLRLIEAKAKRGESKLPELPALQRQNAEKEKELAELRDRLSAYERQSHDKARSAQNSNKELLARANELKVAQEACSQLSAVNHELAEMIYAFANKPLPGTFAIDRANLAALKAELQALVSRHTDLRRKREEPTRLVFENGRYHVAPSSKSKERSAARHYSYIMPSGMEAAQRADLAKSFAVQSAEKQQKVVYYQPPSAISPFTSR